MSNLCDISCIYYMIYLCIPKQIIIIIQTILILTFLDPCHILLFIILVIRKWPNKKKIKSTDIMNIFNV